MISDRGGDIGFMEAMVATMIVIMALLFFMGASSALASFDSDPMDGFEYEFLDAGIADGILVSDNSRLVEGYMLTSGAIGVRVDVLVPGGFCEGTCVEMYGSMDGEGNRRTFISLIEDDDGRKVVAVFGVTVWFRIVMA